MRLLKKHNYNTRFKGIALVLFACAIAISATPQNINRPNKTVPMGMEVNILTGNLFVPRTDVSIPARGFDVEAAFFYNSFSYNENVGFGRGWNFNYNARYANSEGNKIINWGNGRGDLYKAGSGGNFEPSVGIFSTLKEYQPGKLLLTEKEGTKYFFDDSIHKRLSRIEDLNGNFLTFTYNDSLVTSITAKSGQSLSLTYNAKGLLSELTDANGTPTRTYQYSYDSEGNLVQVTDPLGGTYKYSYIVSGPMGSITDKNQNVANVVYFYDLLVSEVIGCNQRISFSYDSASLTTYVTDHNQAGSNQTTRYEFGRNGQNYWFKKIAGNCCGFNREFEYDQQGNKIKDTDANGNTHSYTYDAAGNLLTLTNPLNQTMAITYTQNFNRVATIKDFKGNLYTLEYDGKGNMIKLTEPDNNFYTGTYNSNGDLVSSSDAKGNVYSYEYDSNGNPSKVKGPGGYTRHN